MLICNVSLRPPRRAIAAEIAETGTAVDASAIGNVVFATLVDDPAALIDIVDAYLGEMLLEAASADAAADAGLVYAAAIDEAITAIEAYSGDVPAVLTDAVAETATATSTQNATITSGIVTTALIADARSVVFVTPAIAAVSLAGSTLLTVQ